MRTRQNPLRQIVARTPVSVPIQPGYSTVYYLDTLVAVYPQTLQVSQNRHRCITCGERRARLLQFIYQQPP